MKLTNEQIEAIEESIANGGDVTISFPKPKPGKWEPEGGSWYFNSSETSNAPTPTSNYHRLVGAERQSDEEADIALAGQKRRNILSAWAAENGGEQEFVKGKNNWYVEFDSSCYLAVTNCKYQFEVVYMTKKSAVEFCEWYNEGRIEL